MQTAKQIWDQGVRDNPGRIVLVKVGDFCEAYDEQAQELAKALQITLTKRGESPMVGLPHWRIDRYETEIEEALNKSVVVLLRDRETAPARAEGDAWRVRK